MGLLYLFIDEEIKDQSRRDLFIVFDGLYFYFYVFRDKIYLVIYKDLYRFGSSQGDSLVGKEFVRRMLVWIFQKLYKNEIQQ